MTPDSPYWLHVAGIFLVLILLLGIFLWRPRQSADLSATTSRFDGIDHAIQRVEQVLRTETKINRDEASNRGKLLREEVGGRLKEENDSVVRTMTGVGDLLKGQLEAFAKQLADGTATVDRRIHGLGELLRSSLDGLTQNLAAHMSQLRNDVTEGGRTLRKEIAENQRQAAERISKALTEFSESQKVRLNSVATELGKLTESNERRQEKLRETIEARLNLMRDDNAAKLEQMRQTVDEKLQGTLEKRLGESFQLVSQQLEKVYTSIGEMQNLAIGVGDLKRVLTNVRARGSWGEVQVEALLEQFFTSGQYHKNVETRAGSGQRVEFAIRLPGRGEDDDEVLLPIDAKFPKEDYERLILASEKGDKQLEEAAIQGIETRIRLEAKGISDKYIDPPRTTDFAIMFLATEGLYAEVLRRPGLADSLQRDHRVLVVGPTNLVALLNSLQMGFRTLSIQKRSSEVWQILGAVKTEFGRYGEVLDSVKKSLQQATDRLDKVSVRKRAIDRTLRSVETLSDAQSVPLLGLESDTAEEEDTSESENET